MSAAPDRFLALDAGNSKTVALITDATGTVHGRGRGGRGDFYGACCIEEAEEAVFGAIFAALDDAAATPADLVAAAFCMAGVDYPEDAAFWDERFRARLGGSARRAPAAPIPWTIKNDGFASLRLIDGSGVGVSITIGTGPAIAARGRDGREECSGMFVFDDLGGSGLGNAGLAAVWRAWQGTGPKTALTPALLELYGAPDPWELRHMFTRRFGALGEQDRWRGSRVVLAAADAGDEVAVAIVADQARAFVQYAQWCARQVGEDLTAGDLPVLLNGSVATSEHGAMRDAITAELAQVAPAAKVTIATGNPLCGVVLDALALGGVDVGSELLAKVIGDHPEEFFRT